MTGRLHVCATPIGNLGDVSSRLVEVLGAVSVVYAEDTRRVRTLLDAVGIRAAVRSHFSGNEAARSEEIVARLVDGEDVAIVTDAGAPVVADPGAVAVDRAHDAGIPVTVVPGPSAVTSALAVSGFGGDRFVFEGFLPRKGGERSRRLADIASEPRTLVLFATPHRLLADLEDMVGALGGDRRVCVCRELTKLHEEVARSTLAEAREVWNRRTPRGEYTLVVEGAAPVEISLAEAVAQARRLLAGGETRSAAAREAARSTGVDRRTLYEALGEGGEAVTP